MSRYDTPATPHQVTITLHEWSGLHRKVGFAIGAFEGLLAGWDIPDDLRLVVRDCLRRLEEPT